MDGLAMEDEEETNEEDLQSTESRTTFCASSSKRTPKDKIIWPDLDDDLREIKTQNLVQSLLLELEDSARQLRLEKFIIINLLCII